MIIIDGEYRSRAKLSAVGGWKYSEDPSTDVICLGISYDKAPPVLWKPCDPLPSEAFKRILKGEPVHCRNVTFEKAVYDNVLHKKYGFPAIANGQWRDNMSIGAALSLPLGMDKVAKALHLPHKKDTKVGSKALGKICKPRRNGDFWTEEEAPDDYQTVYEYCLNDVLVEIDFLNMVPREISAQEQRVCKLDIDINTRGLNLDLDLAAGAIAVAAEATKVISAQIAELTDGEVKSLKSPKQILSYARANNVSMNSVTKDEVVDVLSRPNIDEKVAEVLKARQILSKSSTAKFKKMIDIACNDGRARGLVVYHGAATGRWAGRLLQIHNFPRGALKFTETEPLIEAITSQNLSALYDAHPNPFEILSSTLRQGIVGHNGENLLVNDYSGIENRGITWLAGDTTKLSKFQDDEYDEYVEMAMVMYNISDPKEVQWQQRWYGKTAVLGCGYGLGVQGYINTCENYKIDIDPKVAKLAVETYRANNPLVLALWAGVQNAAMTAITSGIATRYKSLAFKMAQGYLFMRLPSGRLLAYPEAKIINETTPWGSSRRNISYMTMNDKSMWVEKSTYGGRLVENAVQAIARDVLADGMIRLDDAGFKIVAHVHDEIICEKHDKTLEEMSELMVIPPEWAPNLPLAVEGFESPRYRK